MAHVPRQSKAHASHIRTQERRRLVLLVIPAQAGIQDLL
jgi:hypothetical protein